MNKKNENELGFLEFAQRFRVIRKTKDLYNRQYQICKDMKTQKRAIIKSYVIQSNQQQQAILENLKNYIELRQIQTLCKLINYTKIENRQIQAAFEFHDITVDQFTKSKTLEKEKNYIVYTNLINQMIYMLAIMQQIGMEIDDIRKTNILMEVTQQKVYKFKLFYDQRQRGAIRSYSGLYLSPQRLKQLATNEDNNDVDGESKIVYELGLLVLDIATQQIKQGLYLQNRINEKIVERKLIALNKKYPNKYLTMIISEMLRPVNQRLTINDIKNKNQSQFGKFRTSSYHPSQQYIESMNDSNQQFQRKETTNRKNSKDNIKQINEYQVINNSRLSNSRKSLQNSKQSSHNLLPQKFNNQPHIDIIRSLQKTKQKLKQLKAETKQYQDGSVYFGQLKSNMRDGLGIYSYTYGDIYFGQWKDNNLINGTYIFKNGQSYQGTVKNGKQGFGKYRYANGNIYEGSWQNDLKHGKGEMKYPNGDRYQGNWNKGKKNGHGIYYYHNGIVYEGNFTEGKKSGYGSITFPDSTRFQGMWQQYYAQGFGKILYQNGEVFEGNFHQSEKNGKGVYKWDDETIYDGEFKEDKMFGYCKLNYSNGDYYQGNINNGIRNGQGTYIYSNKDIFKGVWKDNIKQLGKYHYSEGDVFEGEFKSDQIFFGIMKYANGDTYQGQFFNSKRHGYGKYIFINDKSVCSGEWKQDILEKQS